MDLAQEKGAPQMPSHFATVIRSPFILCMRQTILCQGGFTITRLNANLLTEICSEVCVVQPVSGEELIGLSSKTVPD